MSVKWTTQQAQDWYANITAIKGCNYLPRTAVNSTEMWQAETFDSETIREELSWASDVGYNSIRVFVQYLVWKDDSDGLKQRIHQLLDIADSFNISTALILFDDCAFAGKEPYLGKQDDPLDGIHNSGWTPSPGLQRVTDKAVWSDLEAYVTDIVGEFANDKRVILWDLYNEPGNSGMGEKSTPLVNAVFKWARSVNPTQPLTISVWLWEPQYDQIATDIFELSDVISFHYYRKERLEEIVARCKAHKHPVICTEWLHRRFGQTMDVALPVFAREHIGWYNWGLVAGRTQTYLDWRKEENTRDLKIWQHDIFHSDGSVYDEQEIKQIQSFSFE